MRSSIFAIALIMAIGLLTTVHLSNFSKEAAAQEFVKKKKGPKNLYAKKGEFNMRLCTQLGGTAFGCGMRLQRWGTKNPNGKVIY